MGIDITEAVDPVILYKCSVKERLFDRAELEKQLGEIEMGLDRACDVELKSGEYSAAACNVMFYRSDSRKKLGTSLRGWGFDLTALEGKELALPEFKRMYKDSFRKILGMEDISYPIDIDVSVIGFRDKLTGTVDAIEPTADEQ